MIIVVVYSCGGDGVLAKARGAQEKNGVARKVCCYNDGIMVKYKFIQFWMNCIFIIRVYDV